MTDDTTKLGTAGELLVAAQLTLLDCAAALAPAHTKDIDLFVYDGTTVKMVQVKTTRDYSGKKEPKADWACPIPRAVRKDLYYVFVTLNEQAGGGPDFLVVPSADVYRIVTGLDKAYRQSHPAACAGKPGVRHFILPKDGKEYKMYKDNWNLLVSRPTTARRKPKA